MFEILTMSTGADPTNKGAFLAAIKQDVYTKAVFDAYFHCARTYQ
jgi:hypothetical protein